MTKLTILMVLFLKVVAEKKYNFNLKFFQKDYQLKPEWLEVVSYDKKYVKEMVTPVFKPNRTVTACNLTLTFNVDVNNLQFVGQAYRFASNEYREFPLRLQAGFCQVVEQDFFGLGEITKCGNFTRCFFAKGRKYHLCNWIANGSRLPPYIPSGSYMAEVQGMYHSNQMFVFRGYAAITRPILPKD